MAKPSAEGVRWDLRDLYASANDPALTRDLEDARRRAVQFESDYKPGMERLASGGDVPLFKLIKDYEIIVERLSRPYAFASLLFSSDTRRPEHGALLQKVRQAATEVRAHYLFWELIWSRLEESRARAYGAKAELAPYRHYLSQLRHYAPYLRPEPEEKILDVKDNTGVRAFVRLFDEVNNGIVFTVKQNGLSQGKTESEVLAMLHAPDRPARREGHRSLTAGLRENAHVLGFVFNRVLEDHRNDMKIRGYEHSMTSRNLANETTLPVVEQMIAAVKRAYPLVARYYELKRRLLGLEALYDYDRYAPVSDTDRTCRYETCEKIVREAYHAFDNRAGEIVDRFFDKHWIDAELRAGKQGGAFSASTVPDLHPYVLVNYADRMRDVMTVAHELGHGVHQYLSRQTGILECHAPLTLAECASVFGEMLVFDRLMSEERDERARLGLLCGKIEDIFATVFRQVVLTDFELRVHEAVANGGELSIERLSDLWMEANRPMHGQAVMLTPEYRYWWIYIGHFIHTPFYCYAYAFAELVVLAMYERYKHDRPTFVSGYLRMLALGGSRKPEELCALVGLDIAKPDFWQTGLAIVERMVGQAEELAGVLHA